MPAGLLLFDLDLDYTVIKVKLEQLRLNGLSPLLRRAWHAALWLLLWQGQRCYYQRLQPSKINEQGLVNGRCTEQAAEATSMLPQPARDTLTRC